MVPIGPTRSPVWVPSQVISMVAWSPAPIALVTVPLASGKALLHPWLIAAISSGPRTLRWVASSLYTESAARVALKRCQSPALKASMFSRASFVASSVIPQSSSRLHPLLDERDPVWRRGRSSAIRRWSNRPISAYLPRMADWTTISALATAGGTLVLAVATFASVRSANAAARTAERTLQAGLRPVLFPSRSDDPPRKVVWGDRHFAMLNGARAKLEIEGDVIYLTMGLRNMGS